MSASSNILSFNPKVFLVSLKHTCSPTGLFGFLSTIESLYATNVILNFKLSRYFFVYVYFLVHLSIK